MRMAGQGKQVGGDGKKALSGRAAVCKSPSGLRVASPPPQAELHSIYDGARSALASFYATCTLPPVHQSWAPAQLLQCLRAYVGRARASVVARDECDACAAFLFMAMKHVCHSHKHLPLVPQCLAS